MLFPTKNAINHKKIVLITFCQQTNNLNVFCNICVGTHLPHGGKTYIPMSVLVHFINLQPFHPQPLGFEANWAPDVSPGNLGPWKILCGKLGPWKIGLRQNNLLSCNILQMVKWRIGQSILENETFKAFKRAPALSLAFSITCLWHCPQGWF